MECCNKDTFCDHALILKCDFACPVTALLTDGSLEVSGVSMTALLSSLQPSASEGHDITTQMIINIHREGFFSLTYSPVWCEMIPIPSCLCELCVVPQLLQRCVPTVNIISVCLLSRFLLLSSSTSWANCVCLVALSFFLPSLSPVLMCTFLLPFCHSPPPVSSLLFLLHLLSLSLLFLIFLSPLVVTSEQLALLQYRLSMSSMPCQPHAPPGSGTLHTYQVLLPFNSPPPLLGLLEVNLSESRLQPRILLSLTKTARPRPSSHQPDAGRHLLRLISCMLPAFAHKWPLFEWF